MPRRLVPAGAGRVDRVVEQGGDGFLGVDRVATEPVRVLAERGLAVDARLARSLEEAIGTGR